MALEPAVENIYDIFVTFEVSHDDKSPILHVVAEEPAPWNIPLISVTFDVFQFDKSKLKVVALEPAP